MSSSFATISGKLTSKVINLWQTAFLPVDLYDMRYLSILIVVTLLGCGGSLSEEQRKQLREAQQQQTIKKISEADLLAAAFTKGRALVKALQKEKPDAYRLDSLQKTNQVIIRWHELSAPAALAIEQQVIEAYLVAASTGSTLADNVQRIGTDTLLYTMPLTRLKPDSVTEVLGIWSIRMPTKVVVLNMESK
jgi:hypothetical protein